MRKRINLRWLSPRVIWSALTGQPVRRAIRALTIRSYALLIFAMLLAAGYLAVHYLVAAVFLPTQVPPQMLEWAGRLDVAALRSTQTQGVERTAPRAPVSHYHGVNQWFQPDNGNGCTLSGCHEPLPHDQRAKVPAFANFHTTFLTCQMCHATPQQRPAATRWVSTDTNVPQDAPAILQLLEFLESNTEAIQAQPASVSQKIKVLLGQTVATLGQDAYLDGLLAELQSTDPGSPVWKSAITQLQTELPLHASGEYRAKLAWTAIADQRITQFQTLSSQARQFLDAPDDSAERKSLQTSIHASLAPAAASCVTCHDNQPAILDFHAAGYSPRRSTYLSHLEIARLMQQIRQGEHFIIPNLMGGGQ